MEKIIIGIDEVGRGPLAGPVVVCALAMPKELRIRNHELGELRDSKKLTALQREKWAAWVKAHPRIMYAVSRVYPRGIERLNITQAANLAATRACMRLCRELSLRAPQSGAKQSYIRVLLDGGLYLRAPEVSCRTIIKGDEKYTAIKLASIVAKVTRDRFMDKLHKKYPHYGFNEHKGYGTRKHVLAIKKYGAAPVHRVTFLKKFI